ncbi:M28 family metallopeptidase [Pontibacter locisalis]|uniref:M28 family metallopeptidase n=1 Tax=Pontibacter locisalis TaxID=1719035 RepID=A0ABW5IP14_9BACT
MKQLLNFLLLLLLSSPAVFAQDMIRVRQTVDTLASRYFHGRGYIRSGDEKAADYLRNRFQEMGLKSFEDSYLQHFSFPVNRIVETPELQIDGKALVAGKHFVAQASSNSGAGKAELLFLDTLIFTDQAAAYNFFSQKFKSKALVIRQQDLNKLNELPQPYRQKLHQAKLHIILQPKALVSTVALKQQATPVLEVKESLWPANAKQVGYNIKAEVNPRHRAQNVIAYVEGSAKPDSFIVFTAHYDHLGGQGEGVYFPGANDNASGTAMLLELAQYYSQPDNKPDYSIAFIAFAAEEAGLLGSFHYVQNPLFPLQDIRFLINLDLLGTGEEGMMVVNGKVHEPEFALLTSLNKQHQYLPQLKSRGKAANSDHYPFSEKGVPAFFFYTLGGTTAYHNTQDYADQLPLTKFTEVFQLITNFTEQLQR